MSLNRSLQILFVFVKLVWAQNHSPCPSIFAYEPKGTENDRWYGRITITTPDRLTGVWLRISLDRPAELLGNWFGEASSSDNRDYLIKNANHVLEPKHEPLSLRFFVKYDTSNPIVPSLTSIRLNGRLICPTETEKPSGATTPTLHISQLKPSESSNVNQQGSYGGRHTTRTTTTTTSTTPTPAPSVDDDYFDGDFTKPSLSLNSGIPSNNNCGTVKTGARPLITYGQETVEGEWPWHTALYRYKGLNMQYICGGSLISPNHILTAAHCVTKSKSAVSINADLLVVFLGKYNLYKADTTVQSIKISKVTPHPEFNGTYLYNDLAILQLEHAAEITDFVRTVCLWEGDTNLVNIVERLGTVVGWGFDQTGELTESLMMTKMPVVSLDTCIYSNRDFFAKFTTTKTFCAGFRNGTSACTGDSGGGMVFPRPGTSGANTIWQIRGIVSLSVALQNDKLVCDTNAFVIFTDVAKYLDWINKTIR